MGGVIMQPTTPQQQPQSQYNPTELVTIRNSKTKEMKRVPRQELPKYGLSTDFQSPGDIYSKAINEGRMSLDQVPSEYKDTTSYILGQKDVVESKKNKEAQDVKSDLGKKAQGVLDVLDAGKSGKLKGQAYRDALDAAASGFAASSGFGQGGKALTAPELTVLGGSIPAIQEEGTPGWLTFLTGKKAVQRGHVVDPEETLRRKAQIAIGVSKGKVDLSQLEGATPQGGQSNDVMQNAGSDAKNMLNGILNMPKQVVDQAGQNLQAPFQQGPNIGNIPAFLQTLQNPLQGGAQSTAMSQLPGMVSNVNETAGRPMEGGDIAGRMGQHAQEHPLDTLMTFAPFLFGGVKGLGFSRGGKAAEGGEIAATQAGGNPVGDMFNNMGKSLRGSVRQIDVGPSLYGPQREARISQTLDTLGIKGPPTQQYAQLQPKLAQLGDAIQKELEAHPKDIPITTIQQDFMANLQDQLQTKNLTAAAAKKEVSGYLSDLYGGKISGDISTPELFKLKQKINQQYKSVQKKIDNGTSLNDREKVIYVARQTLDDIIANEHPNVKQMTLMQSDLYDAVDPLYRQRKDKPNIRGFGNSMNLPEQITRGPIDALGRVLQGQNPFAPEK